MRWSWNKLHLVAVLCASLLFVGCASDAKTRAALANKPDQPAAPVAQPAAIPELPGSTTDLAAALGEKSPVKYKVLTIGDTQGKDVSAYFDQALEQASPLPPDTMLLMVFTKANYDIRFALGADFAAKQVTSDEVLALVRSAFLPEARKGDPAEGLAKLVRTVNQRVSH